MTKGEGLQLLGRVHATGDTPTPSKFYFVVEKTAIVEKGQFVVVDEPFGRIIARVENVIKSNRYFSKPEAVIESERLEKIFPIDEWEFLIAEAKPLAVIKSNGAIERPTLPPTPGKKVFMPSEDTLAYFLGLDPNGLWLGDIWKHNIKLRVNMSKLLQKHLAILAMSGAGKSYLTAVLIEELLERGKDAGRIGIAVIDTHGEYVSFAEPPPPGIDAVDYSDRAHHVVGVKIPISEFDVDDFRKMIPNLSGPQVRELRRILAELKKAKPVFDFDDLFSWITRKVGSSKTAEVLKSWLRGLESSGLFASKEEILVKNYKTGEIEVKRLVDILNPGEVAIFDLSNILDNWLRQIIVYWISSRIFSLRRAEKIPPILLVVEEAHNYIPQGEKKEEVPSRSILETISREGRKFMCSLCVISQRPVKLSTTVLSQCNTQIIMRITNPSDLEQIRESSEGISREAISALTTLQVGDALIVGEAVRIPVFFKVRRRKSWEKKGKTLEEAAREWEMSQEGEDIVEEVMGSGGFEA